VLQGLLMMTSLGNGIGIGRQYPCNYHCPCALALLLMMTSLRNGVGTGRQCLCNYHCFVHVPLCTIVVSEPHTIEFSAEVYLIAYTSTILRACFTQCFVGAGLHEDLPE